MLTRLTNVPRDYAWGSTTLLAEFEGRSPSGAPEAEVWFGDHPSDPADVVGGGSLRDITDGSLPYLLKLLAAGAPLSIQVHPTLEQAKQGWAAEAGLALDAPERNYRDDNHKPELIVALSDRFDALGGIRPVADTLRLLDVLGASPAVDELRDRLLRSGGVKETIGWLLSGETQAVVDGVIGALEKADDAEFADTLGVLRSISAQNPGDAGVVVALLMNHIALRRGEGIFLRAGLLHAYVAGLGVEIMAASDNVLRGGLTPKYIDVPELLSVLDATPGVVPVLRPDTERATTEYPVAVTDFALRRVELSGEPVAVSVHGPSMVLSAGGQVCVAGVAESIDLPVGGVAYASADEQILTLTGIGEAFIAQPGPATASER